MTGAKIGYARVSKTDTAQSLDMQLDAFKKEGILDVNNIYTEHASGADDSRVELNACLRALRAGDTLVLWRLDRLGRSTVGLVNTVSELDQRGVYIKTLTGIQIDTASPTGKLIFTVFAALAEYERELIRERVTAGLQAARARGRCGGRPAALTKAQLKIAQALMRDPETHVGQVCEQLGVGRSTLYRYVSGSGELRGPAVKVMQAD